MDEQSKTLHVHTYTTPAASEVKQKIEETCKQLNHYEKVHPPTRKQVSLDALSALFKCRDEPA